MIHRSFNYIKLPTCVFDSVQVEVDYGFVGTIRMRLVSSIGMIKISRYDVGPGKWIVEIFLPRRNLDELPFLARQEIYRRSEFVILAENLSQRSRAVSQQ